MELSCSSFPGRVVIKDSNNFSPSGDALDKSIVNVTCPWESDDVRTDSRLPSSEGINFAFNDATYLSIPSFKDVRLCWNSGEPDVLGLLSFLRCTKRDIRYSVTLSVRDSV